MKYFRLLLSLVLLGVLCYWVGTDEIIKTFTTLDWSYLVCFMLFSIPMIWASSIKWRLFVRAGGHEVSVFHLMKLYTIGYFFNTFMPSTFGGDVARSFHLGKHVSNQGDAFAATFLERFTGLLAMALIGVLFVALGSAATKGVELAVLAVGAGTLIVALICFSPAAGKLFFSTCFYLLQHYLPSKLGAKLTGILGKIEIGMKAARNDLPLFAKAMALSVLFHAMTVVNTYLAARTVGWQDPSLAGLFVVVPLVLLVGLVPLTPSGLGIQEGAFLFFLKRIGASEAQALGVGIVLRVKLLLIAAVGCVLWGTLQSKSEIPRPEVEA